jgi:hypothetical protein
MFSGELSVTKVKDFIHALSRILFTKFHCQLAEVQIAIIKVRASTLRGAHVLKQVRLWYPLKTSGCGTHALVLRHVAYFSESAWTKKKVGLYSIRRFNCLQEAFRNISWYWARLLNTVRITNSKCNFIHIYGVPAVT